MKLTISRLITIVFFGSLAVVLISGFLILNHQAKPLSEADKEKALTNLLGRPVVLKEKKVATGNTFHQGKYVSFYYPAAAIVFTPKYNGKPYPSSNLEDFFLSLGDNPRTDVTTSVVAPSSLIVHLEDYPAVRFRQSEPGIYQQSTISAGLETGLSFTKTEGGFEKTAFFMVNGRIYIFSVQNGDTKTATDLYNEIVSTAKFL